MAKRARNKLVNTAVGYVRRSTDKQEQSIPDQKKAIESYAAENGLKISKFYLDDAISGTSTVKRKAFLKMLKDAESNLCEFKYIIVYDVKRFGRLDIDTVDSYPYI
jgi:site-specific DNA recombinase